MQFGPFRFEIEKSYDDLVQIINRTKGSSTENLKGNSHAQLREYKSWVFSCVSIISERISTVEYGFYRKDTGDELFSNNRGYKVFTKPIISPNPLMSFRFLKSFCMLQLDLCGMSCVYKAKNKLGQVWELWPLNMDDLINIKVNDNFLNPKIKYTFKFDDKQVTFDDSELVVFKYPNPISMYQPMSPIQAQAHAIDIDTYVSTYERDFFKNSARIDMALYTESEIDQDKADEIKNRWKSKYSGNFHDIAVLSHGLKPVPLKFTNKDFEFLNLANWSFEKIISAYKVPKSKLGGGGANRASSVIDDISFNRECIQPRLTIIDEELTREVLASFDDKIEFRHYNPVPRDRGIEVNEARVYLAGMPTMTVNEFRKETKIGGPIEGGDKLYIPNGFIALEDLGKELPQGTSTSGGDNATDPTRHDNDAPKVNPDGTDDRDDNPTEGRSVSINFTKENLFTIEKQLREVWCEHIFSEIKELKEENFIDDLSKSLKDIVNGTIKSIYSYYNIDEKIFNDSIDWIKPISEKTALEYFNTIFKHKNNNEIKEPENINRVIKITNSLLRATINYSKYIYFNSKNIKYTWEVNSNECVHKNKVKQVEDYFLVGGTKIYFPNQIFNFSCDCTITQE